MAETSEELLEIAINTYDQLPNLADAFLAYAKQGGLDFDLDEPRHHSKLTFDSATILFRWCELSHTSHGIGFKSPERDFEGTIEITMPFLRWHSQEEGPHAPQLDVPVAFRDAVARALERTAMIERGDRD